jgi:hypothetical protein
MWTLGAIFRNLRGGYQDQLFLINAGEQPYFLNAVIVEAMEEEDACLDLIGRMGEGRDPKEKRELKQRKRELEENMRAMRARFEQFSRLGPLD